MRILAATLAALAVLAASACKPEKSLGPEAAASTAAKPDVSRPRASKPQPKTETPPENKGEALRFDMTQQGQAQTAENFDAWMEQQGVKVAKGAPPPGAPQESSPASGEPPVQAASSRD